MTVGQSVLKAVGRGQMMHEAELISQGMAGGSKPWAVTLDTGSGAVVRGDYRLAWFQPQNG